ncbi:two-component sensor histidine kinase [Spinactinospora alkalitolerans]|uniref:Two-component sensor histidine kinase n=1 Tax=Spinactinospora alkalitolerans TaxID=687207 RepID=A0A852U3M0_9ACTN|nr:ATP-binding protein [Spinactinospora alkalitolerans]NYE50818.1 two-component sensor histidine kinase [Spinactinospora alkalitolerans]
MSRAVLLPHVPSSVTAARQHLCSDLHDFGVGAPEVDDAALIISELLSNALRHASPLPPPFPPDSVRVSWNVVLDTDGADSADGADGASSGGWIEISVCDGGAETLPRIARPSLSALGGRGLGIVQHLATKWGTEVDDATTTVWAVLEVPESGSPRAESSAAPGTAAAPPAGSGPMVTTGALAASEASRA